MVESKLRDVHYEVKLGDGRLVKRHINHIQPCTATCTDAPETQQDEDNINQIYIPSSSGSTSLIASLNELSTQELPRNQQLPRFSQKLR